MTPASFLDDTASTLVCPQASLVVALGIISAPEYHGRRLAQRHSWMRWPNVGHGEGQTICASFVVRAGDAPLVAAAKLQREADVHGDLLLVRSIAYNESRARGPLLSLAWWLLYAHRALPRASFIGKLDDDAYLHAPDLMRMLRVVSSTVGAGANVFLGVLTWYHWYERLFDNSRHAWTFRQAVGVGRQCRTHELQLAGCHSAGNKSASGCGRCIGPFAFAAGYLIVCSRALLDDVATVGGLEKDALRFDGIAPSALRTKAGQRSEQVMEDVWLGYILHAYPLPKPVHYVSLLGDRNGTLYVDAWDFRIARSAVLTHVITKQPERFLALHDYAKRDGWHCSATFELRCAAFCATRAKWSAAWDGRKPEWCARAPPITSTGEVLADQWCTIQSIRKGSQCCGAATASCTQVFGSNSWPKPFQQAARSMRRFVAVGDTGALLTQPRGNMFRYARSEASSSILNLSRRYMRRSMRHERIIGAPEAQV